MVVLQWQIYAVHGAGICGKLDTHPSVHTHSLFDPSCSTQFHPPKLVWRKPLHFCHKISTIDNLCRAICWTFLIGPFSWMMMIRQIVGGETCTPVILKTIWQTCDRYKVGVSKSNPMASGSCYLVSILLPSPCGTSGLTSPVSWNLL